MFRRILLSSETAALFALLLLVEDSRYPLLLLAAALVHECGHLLAAHLCGAKFKLSGVGLGGICIEFSCMNLSYQKELAIVLAGALFNFIAATLFTIMNKFHIQSLPVSFFVMCNFTLGIINLVPAKFFDGSTALKCALLLTFDDPAALKIHAVITILTSILLWLTAVYIQLILGGNLSLLLISIYLMLESFSPQH